MIRGHEHVVERFTTLVPHFPLLFVGPPSVGKWATAEAIKEGWGVSESDVLRIKRLTVAEAREAVQFAYMAPMAGPLRLVIARLHPGTEENQNILLKAVEEAPHTTKFILIASGETPLPTVSSRCVTVPFRLLSTDDLAAILEDRGFKPGQARVWAERGEGQVKRALAYREVSDAKPMVATVVKAFREKDPGTLEKVADGWTDAHTDLLTIWCNEAISRHWTVFSEEEASTRGRAIPMKILVALRTDVRPKLVVKSVLADLLRSMS